MRVLHEARDCSIFSAQSFPFGVAKHLFDERRIRSSEAKASAARVRVRTRCSGIPYWPVYFNSSVQRGKIAQVHGRNVQKSLLAGGGVVGDTNLLTKPSTCLTKADKYQRNIEDTGKLGLFYDER